MLQFSYFTKTHISVLTVHSTKNKSGKPTLKRNDLGNEKLTGKNYKFIEINFLRINEK